MKPNEVLAAMQAFGQERRANIAANQSQVEFAWKQNAAERNERYMQMFDDTEGNNLALDAIADFYTQLFDNDVDRPNTVAGQQANAGTEGAQPTAASLSGSATTGQATVSTAQPQVREVPPAKQNRAEAMRKMLRPTTTQPVQDIGVTSTQATVVPPSGLSVRSGTTDNSTRVGVVAQGQPVTVGESLGSRTVVSAADGLTGTVTNADRNLRPTGTVTSGVSGNSPISGFQQFDSGNVGVSVATPLAGVASVPAAGAAVPLSNGAISSGAPSASDGGSVAVTTATSRQPSQTLERLSQEQIRMREEMAALNDKGAATLEELSARLTDITSRHNVPPELIAQVINNARRGPAMNTVNPFTGESVAGRDRRMAQAMDTIEAINTANNARVQNEITMATTAANAQGNAQMARINAIKLRETNIVDQKAALEEARQLAAQLATQYSGMSVGTRIPDTAIANLQRMLTSAGLSNDIIAEFDDMFEAVNGGYIVDQGFIEDLGTQVQAENHRAYMAAGNNYLTTQSDPQFESTLSQDMLKRLTNARSGRPDMALLNDLGLQWTMYQSQRTNALSNYADQGKVADQLRNNLITRNYHFGIAVDSGGRINREQFLSGMARVRAAIENPALRDQLTSDAERNMYDCAMTFTHQQHGDNMSTGFYRDIARQYLDACTNHLEQSLYELAMQQGYVYGNGSYAPTGGGGYAGGGAAAASNNLDNSAEGRRAWTLMLETGQNRLGNFEYTEFLKEMNVSGEQISTYLNGFGNAFFGGNELTPAARTAGTAGANRMLQQMNTRDGRIAQFMVLPEANRAALERAVIADNPMLKDHPAERMKKMFEEFNREMDSNGPAMQQQFIHGIAHAYNNKYHFTGDPGSIQSTPDDRTSAANRRTVESNAQLVQDANALYGELKTRTIAKIEAAPWYVSGERFTNSDQRQANIDALIREAVMTAPREQREIIRQTLTRELHSRYHVGNDAIDNAVAAFYR